MKIMNEWTGIKDTYTTGENKYLVALATGGLMECPETVYINFMIIRADNERDAEIKYNNINHCEYYYGKTLRRL